MTASGDQKAVTVGKWAKIVGVALAAALPAVMGSLSAIDAAKSQSSEVKDKAESGYQFVTAALTELRTANDALRADLAKVTLDVADLRRRQVRSTRRLPPVLRVPDPTPLPVLTPLPADLDRALVKQQEVKAKADAGAKP